MTDLLVKTDPALVMMRNVIVDRFSPRRVVLFGRRARGDALEESDYDLMVEVDRELLTRELPQQMHDAVDSAVDIRFNLVIRTPRAFELKRDDPGFIDWDISRDGVVVYERERYGPLASGSSMIAEPAGGRIKSLTSFQGTLPI